MRPTAPLPATRKKSEGRSDQTKAKDKKAAAKNLLK
jgi:hypothetical protein